MPFVQGLINGVQVDNVRIVVIMVGLPARGKSLIAQKIVRYLTWLSIESKCFNVGSYRRAGTPQPNADFFSTGNKEGEKLRRAAAEAAVADMIKWFEKDKGVVAVLDATNSTAERRRWIAEICEKNGYQSMFVESVCDDQEIITGNILEVKTTSPDYKEQDPEKAIADFRKRIQHYEAVYETITEMDLTFVKLINVSTQIVINRVSEYMQSRIVYFLMNLHIKPRRVWLSRHGESEFNVLGKIGGDAELSPRGRLYAERLPELIAETTKGRKPVLWTSTLRRTIQTAKHLSFPRLEWKGLDELDAGVCDGLTYAEIEAAYPEDFKARDDDKYNYRYRGGESYRDVVTRLEPIIMELERNEDVFIVSHQAVIRCIYAYFMDIPQSRSPWLKIPLHTVMCLEPKAYGTSCTMIAADIPAVSTFREKFSSALESTPESTPGSAGVDEGIVA